jgi:signal transduction histidine kinase
MLFFVAGWFGVVGASLVMVLGDMLGWEISREATLDAIRLAMVFDAIMMGFAMAERVLQIRRERDAALGRHVESLRSNLDLHQRLNRLEGRYSETLELAKRSGKVLADATHDIRQPLFALRSSLTSMTREHSSQSLASAARTLLYLEELVEEYLEQALSVDAIAEKTSGTDLGVPASVLLTAISDMFDGDAKARGLKLRVRPSKSIIYVNSMAIARIVSNFVANAVHYTNTGGVLVAVKKRDGAEYISVYDTGPGMSGETLNRVLQRAQRGGHCDEQGKGLGLDIALELS